ncbi:photosynthetic NDH subunit of lumenal location 1, chloroplastic-like [Papaver somniferum]|uniref:photosynthetic NDH subunit of lumenal location 1, chloroplastic-like n=1 Tax=Papaver somniferum TaxID=3469 RepID=UPI000E6F7948|nr:photosynthetic NDH subunit of lumenal location 1, chloroplastic-like [Papaver somniferum]
MATLSVPVVKWGSFLPKQQNSAYRCTALPSGAINSSSMEATSSEESFLKRRPILLGVGGALVTSLFPATSGLAKEGLENYQAFVDLKDGYTYYHPDDWVDFDFRGHDSAFKDRYLPLQNVRVSFIPTDKKDVHELGPMDEVIYNLVKHKFSAPTQTPTIFDMQERTVDGRNYYTFEYDLTSKNFSRTAFATIAIGNGRYYTLIVGANERRWKKVRNQLKVVADSFKVLEI